MKAYINSSESLYVQISAGRGPAECCWVVAQVLKVLLKDIQQKGFNYEILNRQLAMEKGTLSSALLLVKGSNLKDALKEWEGTIQWIGKSPYRKFHKRKNWFVGVSFFEEEEKEALRISDLSFQRFRASGPGGQHRNKVETAIRAIHKPTGLCVTATDSKSQHQNKQAAIEKMKFAFQAQRIENMQSQIDAQWREHLSLERGNAVKVFRGTRFE
ncbi:peptide chain release factor H [Sediminitomix flava]|uniref:Peptide chain release factor n=1 Tax=Sediminitomix flava TaxID=379075 RepID=A0A315ZDH8_SEDFL|nr:peptide chain release factor H [Sediminitomix flava]PWJ43179.1 peptide chain release factor [Sediminitomix flava]